MDGFKQRLIGALVLISLAVIFVPMLLDEPHEERVSRSIEIPEEPDFPEVRIEPATPPAADSPIRAVPEPESSPMETASPEQELPPASPIAAEDQGEGQAGQREEVDSPDRPSRVETAQPAEDTLPAPEPVLEPVEPAEPIPAAPAEQAVPDAGGYLVQLGSFGSQSNADRLKESVEGAGFTAYTAQIESGGKTYTRVIAGPFADKNAANAAKLKLDNLFGLNTLVVANDG